jgi:hypothetical protein
MKKSLMIGAALALSTIAGSASALDVGVPRTLLVDGFVGLRADLGVLTFLPLGRAGAYCEYLGNWFSPFNPNDVEICIIRELATNFNPSCIVNEVVDVPTIIEAGGVAGWCRGFNLKGESMDVALLLSESYGVLSGIAAFADPCGIPMIYPVTTVFC